MLKKSSTRALLILSCLSASALAGQDLSQQDSLILRFTGPEAQKLINFMKVRVRLETDYDQSRYYGDRMSLACRDNQDCYLWLSRKEWQISRKASSSVISFTLPVQQNTWSGQLTVSSESPAQSRVQLALQDLYYPGVYSFAQGLSCSHVPGSTEPSPLKRESDCRLELSVSAKKGPSTPPTIQFIQNLDNIIVNFKGPWARDLFSSAPASDVDPHNPERLRVQIGPETFCWNLDPLDQDKFLSDAYVCQSNLNITPGNSPQFVSLGTLKDNRSFRLTLRPSFRKGLLHEFDLSLHAKGQVWTITQCPNQAKGAGFGQCGLLYDMKVDAGLYPLGNSVQGVAVGWGIIKGDQGN